MFRSYVERGLFAGAAGGLAFGLFVALVGNPLVRAIEETGHDHSHGAGGQGASVVSEATTSVVSIGGGVLWGLLLGAIAFGVLYYFLEPAIPGGDATKRYVLAAACFLTVSGAPWLVLPPQPPGVETTLGIEIAMLLYGGMVVVGALVCLGAGVAYTRLRAGGLGQTVAAAGGLAVLATLGIPAAFVQLPTTGEVPTAMTTAHRGVVVFGQVTLWVVLASVHAWLGTPDTESPAASINADTEPAGLE